MLIALALCSMPAQAEDVVAPSYTIRWAQIHLPSSAADRAAFEFAQRVEDRTGGDIDVIVYARTEYEEVAGVRRNALQITKDVVQGELEMTQSYTHVLSRYDPQLKVLGMPYLFRDYDHAEDVFNGPVGDSLVEHIGQVSKLKGFGITYSGGMGVISTQGLDARDPAALEELRILISRGRYARMAFLLGGSYVVVGPDGLVPLARAGLVEAAETTVSCFDVYEDHQVNDTINETHHFLLTSMIIINQEFYEGLPADYQQIISEVAAETVVAERQWSIESTVASREKLTGMGITFYDLSEDEKLAYKERLDPLYGDLLNERETQLADRIRAVGADDAELQVALDEDTVDSPELEDAGVALTPAEAAGCSTGAAAPAALALLLALGLVARREEKTEP